MAKKIVVVGAGPGGLTAAMLLAHQGFDVQVYEAKDRVGGRNAAITLDGYTFDTGPTFLMMTYVLDEIFAACGKKFADYVPMKQLRPMYRLRFPNGLDLFPTDDEAEMMAQIEKAFPGEGEHYRRFKAAESHKFDKVYPCLKVPYGGLGAYLTWRFISALPSLDAFTSVYDRLASYFDAENLRLAHTFQAKYLGMSPWDCPATFTIIPIIEHRWGMWHPIGGLNAVSSAMAKAFTEAGGTLHLSTPVKEVLVEGGRARGVLLHDGTKVAADFVVFNPDFAHGMKTLVPNAARRTYHDEKLASMEYSCSTFMLYLGVKKRYDIPHHNVYFADEYKRNVDEIAVTKKLSEDPSFYIQNACVTDPSLAPEGKSTLYVLVPIANRTAAIDWDTEKTRYRDLVLAKIKERTEIKDLEQQIEVEKIITPADWERDYGIYHGATFNLSHKLSQMLHMRPHNRFQDFAGCYLVGGGTHPGSGLPTIYQSGRIAADLIAEDAGKTPMKALRFYGLVGLVGAATFLSAACADEEPLPAITGLSLRVDFATDAKARLVALTPSVYRIKLQRVRLLDSASGETFDLFAHADPATAPVFEFNDVEPLGHELLLDGVIVPATPFTDIELQIVFTEMLLPFGFADGPENRTLRIYYTPDGDHMRGDAVALSDEQPINHWVFGPGNIAEVTPGTIADPDLMGLTRSAAYDIAVWPSGLSAAAYGPFGSRSFWETNVAPGQREFVWKVPLPQTSGAAVEVRWAVGHSWHFTDADSDNLFDYPSDYGNDWHMDFPAISAAVVAGP